MKQVIRRAVIVATLLAGANANAQFASFAEFGEIHISTPGVNETLDLITVDFALEQLGSHVRTREIVGELFSDINLLSFSASQQLAAELTSSPDIKSIWYSHVQVLPFTLQFTQNANALIADITGLSLSASGVGEDVYFLVCEEPDFSFDISNVTVNLKADLFTGQLSSDGVSYDFSVDVECNGLLGFITNALLSLPIGQSFIDDLAMDIIDAGIASSLQSIDSREIFGLDDIVPIVRQSLSSYSNMAPAIRNLVDSALEDVDNYLNRIILDSGKTLAIKLNRRTEVSGGEFGFFFTLVWNEIVLETNF